MRLSCKVTVGVRLMAGVGSTVHACRRHVGVVRRGRGRDGEGAVHDMVQGGGANEAWHQQGCELSCSSNCAGSGASSRRHVADTPGVCPGRHAAIAYSAGLSSVCIPCESAATATSQSHTPCARLACSCAPALPLPTPAAAAAAAFIHVPSAQQVGSNLVTNVQNVNRLAEVQDNLQQAAAAVRAAQGVLEQCMAAGQLINEHQLYPALCMLDKIRRKHLGELRGCMVQIRMSGSGSAHVAWLEMFCRQWVDQALCSGLASSWVVGAAWVVG